MADHCHKRHHERNSASTKHEHDRGPHGHAARPRLLAATSAETSGSATAHRRRPECAAQSQRQSVLMSVSRCVYGIVRQRPLSRENWDLSPLRHVLCTSHHLSLVTAHRTTPHRASVRYLNDTTRDDPASHDSSHSHRHWTRTSARPPTTWTWTMWLFIPAR